MNDLLSGAGEILRRLEEEGQEALLVGGMVRDLLCGLAPCDADIASDAPLPVLASLFPSGRLIGPEGMQVFLLPFGEGHCEVFPFPRGGLKDDLARRDFTVNALALRRTGEVVGSRRAMADIAAGFSGSTGRHRNGWRKIPSGRFGLPGSRPCFPGSFPIRDGPGMPGGPSFPRKMCPRKGGEGNPPRHGREPPDFPGDGEGMRSPGRPVSGDAGEGV